MKGDGNPVAKLDGFADLPTKAAFAHDGARVFVGDFTGTVKVWGVKEKKYVGELTTNPQ